MKQISLFIALMLLTASSLLAQRNITGTIRDENNEPVIGANVVVKGSEPVVGTTTDFNGTYSLKVPNGLTTLTVTYIGYADQEVEIGASNTVDVALSVGVQLDNIVISALGLKSDRDKSANSSTSVNGGNIVKSGETGVIQSLSGKTSGVLINRAAGDPGAGANIQIRGQSTITGNLQPLIILDGMPIYNSSYGTESSEQGTNGALQGVVEQSRLNDINPDDIESIEVLKGAAAAAQWGSRAANGVLVITTKRGKAKEGKDFSIDFRSTYSIDQINRKHPLQSTYGQGNYGTFGGGAAGSSTGNTWGDVIADRAGGADDVATTGPHFVAADGTDYYPIINKNDQTTYLDENFNKIFRTGHYWENALSISSGNEKGSFYASVADMRQQGIIRTGSDYQRTTFRINADRRLGSKLKVSVNAMYTKTGSNRVQQGSNTAGLYLGLLRNSPDFDISDYIGTYYNAAGVGTANAQRGYRRYIGGTVAPAYNNPLWTLNKQRDNSAVNRVITGGELSYDATSWLSFTARTGVDFYQDNRTSYFARFSAGADKQDGKYIDYRVSELQINSDIFARASHSFGENISTNLMLGFNYNDRKFRDNYSRLQGFTLPDAPGSLANGSPAGLLTVDYKENIRTNAGYANLGMDFYKQLFVTLTGRLENASTFGPLAKSSFFYPSASAAWQFSQLVPANDVFSFGKLRLSYGIVGVQPEAYRTSTIFITEAYTNGWDDAVSPATYGTGSYSQNSRAGNPYLRPERKREFEVGTDIRLLKNRLTLGLTYYQNKTTDVILPVDVPGSTGFQDQIANAGTISNKGIEIDFGYDVIKNKQITWNIYGNFSKNKNNVDNLNGVTSVFLNGFEGTSSRAVVGQPLGALWGGSFETDANGKLVLDATGFPQASATEGVIGNPNPKWRGALGSSVTYKGFTLSALFETAQGQQMWGGTRGVLTHFGVHADTDVSTTLTETEAATVLCADGVSVLDKWGDGVDDGGSVTFRGQLHDFGAGNVALDQDWYQGNGGGFGPVASQFIYDASWTRLREVSLSYRLDNTAFQKSSKLGAIELGFTGRNLLLWSPFVGIDPDTNLSGVGNARGLDYFTNPSTRSFLFTLKVAY